MNKSVLVTGANGFVGTALVARLSEAGFRVRTATRSQYALLDNIVVRDIGPSTDWQFALNNSSVGHDPVDAVVHLAARVHVMSDRGASSIDEYRRVNTEGTVRLAAQAAGSGVRRFVFVSTVKVNGEGYCGKRASAYTEESVPRPEDDYGVSKWEAERALTELSAKKDMDVVIVRPPLVYGPHVGANFLRLVRLVERGIPLPLRSVRNRRSLLYIGNFVDALRVCVEHPSAANQTYLLSDGEPVSSPGLVAALANALGAPLRTLPLSPRALRFLGTLLGKRAEIDRLICSLEVDGSKICRDLSWAPPYDFHEGIRATVEWYRQSLSGRG